MASLQTEWEFVVANIIQSASSLFLNGICILLATQASYFLKRRGSAGRGALICAMMLACVFGIVHMIHQVVFTAMFVQLLLSAGTVDAIGTLQDIQVAFQHLRQVKSPWKDIIILVNNFAANAFFIYRCYVIWSESPYKRRVIGVPLLSLLLTTTNVTLAPFFLNGNIVVVFICLVMTNLLLTGLTAGRIWWTRRHLQVICEPKLAHRYKTAIKMLFESSLLYFVVFLVYLLIGILGSPATIESPVVAIFSGASSQLMNIMPALVIVRVSLSRSVDADPTADSFKPLTSAFYKTV
ncbi:hypothetical protein B0H13DRAFT_1921533 [Mycena leptocephala]|nr:hypothetical protein B0H13DRAFT_1921533 [Mycena leptocephala]